MTAEPLGRIPAAVRDAGERGFVELADGPVHYRVDGPADGTPLVLLHGATVAHWEFDLIVPHLHAAGFRTLRFDFYGHGRSAWLRVPYTLELFARQTAEVVAAVGFPQPAIVVGHSVGAAIAAAFAAARPAAIERLVLLAPMLDFSASSRWTPVLRRRVLGELLMRVFGVPGLRQRRRVRYAAIGHSELMARFAEHATFDGIGRTLLSMTRHATLGDQSARYAALRELARDVLVVWGTADRIISAADVARVRELLPPHRYLALDGAGHNLLLTHGVALTAALAR